MRVRGGKSTRRAKVNFTGLAQIVRLGLVFVAVDLDQRPALGPRFGPTRCNSCARTVSRAWVSTTMRPASTPLRTSQSRMASDSVYSDDTAPPLAKAARRPQPGQPRATVGSMLLVCQVVQDGNHLAMMTASGKAAASVSAASSLRQAHAASSHRPHERSQELVLP